MNPLNDQFSRQAQDMFNAAKDARIPENVQHMAEDGVAKTREAYLKINAAAKDGAKVVEDLFVAAQTNAKQLGEKVMHNTVANTEAAFDAAQAIARAKSLPEAAKLQADFMQQQFAIASAQTKEFFELSSKLAKAQFDSMSTVATKTFDQVKKSA
jgi:phasin